MKLRISALTCDQLDLSNDVEPATVLQLQNISNGTGYLEFQDGLSLIHEVVIRKLLANLEIPLGTGVLRTDFPATIEHVTCEGRIRNGFAGELRSSILDSERISVEVANVKATAHLITEGLHVKLDGRGGRIEVGTLTLSNAQCTVGSLLVRLGSLCINGLKVSWDGGEAPHIEATKANARDLQIQSGPATIDIAVIDLSDGLRIRKRVQVAQVAIGAIEIAVANFGREEEPEHEEAATILPDDLALPVPGIELDHGVFDTVNGDLDVDATLSVTLPVIGKRVATHHFQIPIDGGIINYRDFERGLAGLEDAFINIRVRGRRLVLERDIPLIPGLQKPIVIWGLESGEVELASQYLVRIGTLLRFKMAGEQGEDAERAKKSKVRLHRLDFDNISVNLSLDETAVLKSGDGDLRAHVDELQMVGSLHFDPDPEDVVQPTMLAVTAKGLGTVAQNLVIAGHQLTAGITVGSVESFRLDFNELRPKSLSAALKNLSVNDVDFDLERMGGSDD
ncbi:MAG: hypothetical protein GY811_02760 [Myxococcales bacterium]|nr:hypothetical protein [Myxococcales bacterium]